MAEMMRKVKAGFKKKTNEEKNNELLEEMANPELKKNEEKNNDPMMKEMANLATETTNFPEKLKKFLGENKFLVKVPVGYGNTQTLDPFKIYFEHEKIYVEGLERGTSNNLRGFNGYFVKMIARSEKDPKNAIKIFEKGDFIELDLSRPTMVVTLALSGCSFVVGQDSTNENLLYLGHAQCAGGQAAKQDEDLMNYFVNADRDKVFSNKTLVKWTVIGRSGGVAVGLLGWVRGGKLFFALQGGDYDNKSISLVIKEYPRDFRKSPERSSLLKFPDPTVP